MFNHSTLVVNWDAIFQPRGGSPRQNLAAMLSFAELYTYQWPGIKYLPQSIESKMRTAFAIAYFPRILKLYLSEELTTLINKFKLGDIHQENFFQTLLDMYFPFLKVVDGINPIELIKHSWLNPRIQPLTTQEQRRFEQAFKDFQQIILIANTNTPDIEAFIKNLLQNSILKEKFAFAPEILKKLETYQRKGSVPEAEQLLQLLWHLGSNTKILTSTQTGEWKVQTGKLAAQTNSSGFLPKLLSVISGDIVLLSEAPVDLKVSKANSYETDKQVKGMTGNQYFKDISVFQQYAMSTYDNWPYLAIFIIAITLFMWIL